MNLGKGVLNTDSITSHWAREETHVDVPSVTSRQHRVARSSEGGLELHRHDVHNVSLNVLAALDEETADPDDGANNHTGMLGLTMFSITVALVCCVGLFVVFAFTCDGHQEWREWILWHSRQYREVAEEEKKEA